MAQYTNITALPIYGGQDINRQFRALKKNPQIIVATPGRLMDHMDRGSIKFDHVKVVVLDEADEMLNMGFVDDINKSWVLSQKTIKHCCSPQLCRKLSNN